MHLEAWKDVWHDTSSRFVRGALSAGHSRLAALSAFLFTAAVKHKRAPPLFSATLTGLHPTCDIAETSHSSTQKWLFLLLLLLLLLAFVLLLLNRPVFTGIVVRDESWGWTGWHGNGRLSYQWADELKRELWMWKHSQWSSWRMFHGGGTVWCTCGAETDPDMSGTKPGEEQAYVPYFSCCMTKVNFINPLTILCVCLCVCVISI